MIVPATRLVPSGASDPIEIEDYAWSPDHSKLLVYTNTARVWRQNTRGDYWVLDLSQSSGRLRKLGGPDAKPSTLMFAKFSPDGSRVAYVREHNLYVESLADGRITPLTHDGSVTTINGTFDWVYEEELDDRDGFRWSPDGKHIAYWQLDAKGVRDFLLIDNTDSLYSFVKPVQYPKAGTTNSAARIGVVSAAGGPTTWLEIPGDPRNNYLARMDWEPAHERRARAAAQSPADAEHVLRRERGDGRREAAVRRPRQRVDRRLLRRDRPLGRLARRQFGIRLPVGARRVAACVPGLQDRRDAAHHARRVRRDADRVRRHEGRLALLRRLAGETRRRCFSGARSSTGPATPNG